MVRQGVRCAYTRIMILVVTGSGRATVVVLNPVDSTGVHDYTVTANQRFNVGSKDCLQCLSGVRFWRANV